MSGTLDSVVSSDPSSQQKPRSTQSDRNNSRSRSQDDDSRRRAKNDVNENLVYAAAAGGIGVASFILICAIVYLIASGFVNYQKTYNYDNYSDIKPKQYRLMLKFVDYDKFEGQLVLKFIPLTYTKHIILRVGKNLLVNSATLMFRKNGTRGVRGKIKNRPFIGMVTIQFNRILKAGYYYFIYVEYSGITTTQPGGGLYHTKFGNGDDLLIAVRNLTRIDHIVPVIDININEVPWTVVVIAPPNFVAFSTGRFNKTQIINGERYTLFTTTPPITAADLVLLIGTNESIWTDDVSFVKTPLLNRNGDKNITMYNVGLRTGEMAMGSEIQTTTKEYLKKYRFYDLDQIVLLTTEGVKFSDNSALSGNHYVGGSLIVTPSSQHGIHSRLFARMLFGNHLYSRQSYEQALLAALADYTALLTFNDAGGLQVIAKELQKLAMNEEKPHSSKWHSHWAHTYAFPGESKTDKGFKLIVGLHALAQLTEREKFIENLQDLVYSPPNTHFTAWEFARLLKIDGLTCENNPVHASLNIYAYLREIYENDQYPVVRVTSMPGDSSRVKIIQEPYFGQIPLMIRSSSGSTEPFVLCSAISEVDISVGQTFESLYGFYTLFVDIPSGSR